VLENERRLYRLVAEAEIGKPLKIAYLRRGKKRSTEAVIERLKERVTKAEDEKREQAEINAERVAMGISVEGLTESVRRKYKIKDEVKGVRVVDVKSGSDAIGKITEGDIIEEVNFEPVETPKMFEEAVEIAQESDVPITILINRGGRYKFYALRS